jgi:urease accessory protein
MRGLPLELLLLADGRLPAGGHVHSGGVEQAIDTGTISDLRSLGWWLFQRTVTVGAVEATLAAAASAGRHGWDRLVAEAEARSPVPAWRSASRARGRALIRVVDAAFAAFDASDLPVGARDPGWPLPIATGAVVSGLGFAPVDAAVLTLHGGVAEPAQAAVRRLGLDPVGITRVLAGLESTITSAAERAVHVAADEPRNWPATATPDLDLAAAAHAARDDRYFVT